LLPNCYQKLTSGFGAELWGIGPFTNNVKVQIAFIMLDLCRQQSQKHVPDQAMILFAVMEPEEGDAHNVFVDGMLMSPGSEDYKPAALGMDDASQLGC
jgi:hypothetical protein